MRQLSERIDPPDLGAAIDGLHGRIIRVPRQTSFQDDCDGCIRERREILRWCDEQGIKLARLDMARKPLAPNAPIRAWQTPEEQEWEAFIESEDDTHAVIFKTRWG